MTRPRWQYRVLQTGTLPLRPDGAIDRQVEHRCTIVVLWPAGSQPEPATVLLTDPCFTRTGWSGAESILHELRLRGADLHTFHLTHAHHDHTPVRPPGSALALDRIAEFPDASWRGLELVDLPGHSPDLRALVFLDELGRETWIVGDAVLDREWLGMWGYYWPNRYLNLEIELTWRSLGRCLSSAEVIIPGHGGPIEVDPPLLRELLTGFPLAEQSDRVPEMHSILRGRLAAFPPTFPSEGLS